MAELLRAAATGCVLTTQIPEDLVGSVEHVAIGRRVLPRGTDESAVVRPLWPTHLLTMASDMHRVSACWPQIPTSSS